MEQDIAILMYELLGVPFQVDMVLPINEQLATIDSPYMSQVNKIQSDIKVFERNISLPILNIIVQTITPLKSL